MGRASRPADAQSPDEAAKAAALLDRAIAAKGGLEKLRAVKAIVARQTQASRRPDGESQVDRAIHRLGEHAGAPLRR